MPDGCHAGAVKVRGYTYTGSAYVSYSNPQQTTVVLNNNLSVSGPTTVVCGSSAPLVYTLVNGSCASAISWTLPPGWTGTSTTTSITVTPTATNIGPKTVTANVTLCGGTVLHPATTVTPQLFAPGLKPAISGATTICTGINQTYSISNPASGTILWTVTGSGATIVGPNNGSSVTLQYATNGGATLGATITSPCQDNTGNSTIVLDNFTICTGVPYPNPSTTADVTICTQGLAGHLVVIQNSCATSYTCYSNDTDIEPYHANPDYNSSIPVSSGDHRAYQYIVGGAGASKVLTSGTGPGTYHLALYAINACGYSSPSNVIVVVKTCGGKGGRASFAVFPNPSSSQLNIAYTPEETDTVQAKQTSSKTASTTFKGYFVELLNGLGKVVAKGYTNAGGKLSLDVSKLPKNTYYVHIHHGDELIRKQFIVN
ncbi:T9SS type A sorting domain-containing protein [Mucilaginibacter psychrotolerans]|uniref:T9SS type A sorting domain-containing protein n=1 Tax=Mucilaginibacter psychrotolerans TaxID=1524096 RepID=A0A4Y8S5B4_9SPHI|nr:T9SS type A sorting domain-containing protein [Mucilaginibacter psychrotolerans]TFF33657.1 T9SS type A sorting domain-containing protein [Mucilaginibacter psychrotolerans]